MLKIILSFFVVCIALPFGPASARSPDTSQYPVEIVAGGKRYPSLHAYKLQGLKDDLRGVLSPAELREFSAEELYGAIHEIKEQPSVTAQPSLQGPAVPPSDAQVGQMEEMPTVDPSKVKTIIIKPSRQDRSPDVPKTDEP